MASLRRGCALWPWLSLFVLCAGFCCPYFLNPDPRVGQSQKDAKKNEKKNPRHKPTTQQSTQKRDGRVRVSLPLPFPSSQEHARLTPHSPKAKEAQIKTMINQRFVESGEKER